MVLHNLSPHVICQKPNETNQMSCPHHPLHDTEHEPAFCSPSHCTLWPSALPGLPVAQPGLVSHNLSFKFCNICRKKNTHGTSERDTSESLTKYDRRQLKTLFCNVLFPKCTCSRFRNKRSLFVGTELPAATRASPHCSEGRIQGSLVTGTDFQENTKTQYPSGTCRLKKKEFSEPTGTEARKGCSILAPRSFVCEELDFLCIPTLLLKQDLFPQICLPGRGPSKAQINFHLQGCFPILSLNSFVDTEARIKEHFLANPSMWHRALF